MKNHSTSTDSRQANVARERVYLAGKVSSHGWREKIVPNLRNLGQDADDIVREQTLTSWPVIERAIQNRHDYVGPYFISCDHGCYHGQNSHGMGAYQDNNPEVGGGCFGRLARSKAVFLLCMEAIERATVVFAWIDDPTAHGTLFELGYAFNSRKDVIIAGPVRFPELWFVYESSPYRLFGEKSPDRAFAVAMDTLSYMRHVKSMQSPVEEMFFNAAFKLMPIIPQYEIPPYRVDFAAPKYRMVIEIDGHEFHKTKEQRTHDAQRQRALESLGWRVIRFTGSEVYKDAAACAAEAERLMKLNGGVA